MNKRRRYLAKRRRREMRRLHDFYSALGAGHGWAGLVENGLTKLGERITLTGIWVVN